RVEAQHALHDVGLRQVGRRLHLARERVCDGASVLSGERRRRAGSNRCGDVRSRGNSERAHSSHVLVYPDAPRTVMPEDTKVEPRPVAGASRANIPVSWHRGQRGGWCPQSGTPESSKRDGGSTEVCLSPVYIWRGVCHCPESASARSTRGVDPPWGAMMR